MIAVPSVACTCLLLRVELDVLIALLMLPLPATRELPLAKLPLAATSGPAAATVTRMHGRHNEQMRGRLEGYK